MRSPSARPDLFNLFRTCLIRMCTIYGVVVVSYLSQRTNALRTSKLDVLLYARYVVCVTCRHMYVACIRVSRVNPLFARLKSFADIHATVVRLLRGCAVVSLAGREPLSPAMRLPDREEHPLYLRSHQKANDHDPRSTIPPPASTPERPR